MSIRTLRVQPGGGFERVTLETSEPVEPKTGEIVVRIRASSLNYHDYLVVSGAWGPGELRIPLSDGAGEVLAVGSGVSEFAPGDRVVSTFFPTWQDGEPEVEGFATVPGDGIDGFAREQVTMPATAFTHAPKGWSHAEAATLTTAGLTAWRALMEDGALKPGETVLVQGSGGVSVFALQFAKLAGATVIATSSSDDKLARLEALGADQLINYRKDPQWGDTVRRLTGGRGVDHVIEVGGPATLEQSMIAARIGGHIAVIGILGAPAAGNGLDPATAPAGPDRRQPPPAAGHDPGHRGDGHAPGHRSPLFPDGNGRSLPARGKRAAFRENLPGYLRRCH
ncbi:NAD(P)-dependent alcohol dehydrogenase [Azotobacter salinestris]